MLTAARSHQRGLSILEIAITLTILGILIAAGLPAFGEWTRNTQVRTQAESVLAGLQQARTEAIRSNRLVRFELLSPGTTGQTGWRLVLPNEGSRVVTERPSGEAGSVTLSVTPTPSTATAVTFSGYGRLTGATNANGTPMLSQVDVSAANATRPMRVLVGAGGLVRMCDPAVATDGDPRKC